MKRLISWEEWILVSLHLTLAGFRGELHLMNLRLSSLDTLKEQNTY